MISFLLLTMNIYLPLDIFHNMRRFARFGTIWSILKNMKNTNRGLLLLVQLQSEACNFTKSNTPSWVFFTFLKFYKWYQIVQSISYFQTIPSYQIHYLIITDNHAFMKPVPNLKQIFMSYFFTFLPLRLAFLHMFVNKWTDFLYLGNCKFLQWKLKIRNFHECENYLIKNHITNLYV